MRFKRKTKSGFTIIETLIASIIFITIVFSMAAALTASIKLNKYQSYLSQAQGLANDIMSIEIKNNSFSNLFEKITDTNGNSIKNIIENNSSTQIQTMTEIPKVTRVLDSNVNKNTFPELSSIVETIKKLPDGSKAIISLSPVIQGSKFSNSKVSINVKIIVGKKLLNSNGEVVHKPREVELSTILSQDGIFSENKVIGA